MSTKALSAESTTVQISETPCQRRDIAYIVLNGVFDDARVLKTAYTGRDLGYNVTIYGMTGSRESDDTELNGVRVRRIANPRFGLPDSAWPSDPEKRDMVRFVRLAAERMWTLLKVDRPALLHTHDMYGLYIGAYCQNHFGDLEYFLPWVHDIHEYADGLTTIPKNYQDVARQFEEDFIRQPEALITVCEPISEILTEKFRLAVRPSVVLNCPSQRRKGSREIRSALNLLSTDKIIVYSGNLGSRERGAHSLVEALPFLAKNVHAAFVSSSAGPVVKGLEELALELGVADRVHFHPYVPNDEVTSFLRTADVGCHPMTHFPNGEVALPNKLFEYIHAGIPVAVSDVQEMKRFVTRTMVGEVFASEDPHDLARAVSSVLENADVYRSRITEELKSKYSWEEQEKKVRDTYRSLLELDARGERRKAGAARSVATARIFHGPVSVAGQPWMIANAERGIGLQSDHVLLYPSGIARGYPAHRTLAVRSGFSTWSSVSRVLKEYDLLHLYTRPLVQRTGAHLFPSGSDLLMAKAMGIPTVMHFQGSEVRLASSFRQKNPFHWLDEDDSVAQKIPERAQLKFIDLCRALSSRMIVLDPELRTYVPDAQIVERAIDLGEWQYVGPAHESRPLVVHAPSNRLFKGTNYVLQAVEELKGEGVQFDFQLLEGLSNDEVRNVMQRSDIVVDQLRIGWYGVLACEAMALGKPVVAYIRDDLVDNFDGRMPIVNCSPNSIKETLRRLISDPQLRKEQGQV
ncbi:glycosyltransferase [Nitratireductor rhodophyticola]|nr:glycosyltransferase [Nitratireductor rhodophyticola]